MFFFYYPKYTYGFVWKRLKWPRCTHTGATVQFFSDTLLPFCFVLPRVNIFHSWYNFPDAHGIFIVRPPIYMLHVDTPSYSMPPTQFTQHFDRSPTSPQGHLRLVYSWKQVYFLLFFSVSSVQFFLVCHPHNLRGILTRPSALCIL